MLILSVEYLHSKNIIHKDLNPWNILIHELENGFGIIKIIDFGHTKKETINTYTDYYNSYEDWKVTASYICPEILKGKNLSNKVDIWVIGIVLYQLLSKGKHPFCSKGFEHIFEIIDRVKSNQQ